MSWTATTIAGRTSYCCRLPDGRWAYVQPSRQPGRWRLHIVSRPGRQAVADLYETKATVEDCMKAAERHGRRAAA